MGRYMVTYNFEGEALNRLRRASAVVAGAIDEPDASKRILPHLTILPPRNMDDAKLEELLRNLRNVTKSCYAGELALDGFGTFPSSSVVYVNVDPSDRTRQVCAALRHTLGINSPLTMHATIANKITAEKYDRAFATVQKMSFPRLELPFDHLALMAKTKQGWQVRERCAIGG